MKEEALHALIEKQSITELLHHYCWCVDHGEIGCLLAEVFTEDAIDDHGQAGTARGIGQLRRMFNGLTSWSEGHVHILGNVQISLASGTGEGTAKSTFTAYHWTRERAPHGADRPADFVAAGFYEDQVRLTPAGWRIALRRVTTTAPSFVVAGGMPQLQRTSD